MATTQTTAPDISGRPSKISRNRTVSTKLTELEFAEAERAAAARGQWLSEWARDLLLRGAVADNGGAMDMHIFTELVGIQMLLMNTLEPLLSGEKLSREQVAAHFRQVQTAKAAKAQELLAKRSQKQEK
jgi:hypothetical protein